MIYRMSHHSARSVSGPVYRRVRNRRRHLPLVEKARGSGLGENILHLQGSFGPDPHGGLFSSVFQRPVPGGLDIVWNQHEIPLNRNDITCRVHCVSFPLIPGEIDIPETRARRRKSGV